jgi:hypothetical protein
MSRFRPSSLCFLASLPALLFAALLLGGCESGPVTAFDTLPSKFGQLSFSAAPKSGLANTCLGPFVAQLQDSEGDPLASTSESEVSMTLIESSQTATFYSDGSCTQSFDPIAGSPSIPDGSSSLSFYLVFPAPVSDVTVTATADGDFSGAEKAVVTLNVN